MENKIIVIYPINVIPEGFTIEEVVEKFKETGFILYDNTYNKEVTKPQVIVIKEDEK